MKELHKWKSKFAKANESKIKQKKQSKTKKSKNQFALFAFFSRNIESKKANLQLLFQLSKVRNGQRIVKDSQRLRCGNQAGKSKNLAEII